MEKPGNDGEDKEKNQGARRGDSKQPAGENAGQNHLYTNVGALRERIRSANTASGGTKSSFGENSLVEALRRNSPTKDNFKCAHGSKV